MSETCPNCGSEDSEEGWSCGSYYEGYFNDNKIETRLIETAGCLRRQRDQLKSALTALMPFVLEEYYPDMCTPAFKSAVETAKRLIE